MLRGIADRVLRMPRSLKRAVAVSLDVFLCGFTVWLAYYLRLGEVVTLNRMRMVPILISIAIATPVFVTMGLYRAIFRFGGASMMRAIVRAIVIYTIPFATICLFVVLPEVPRTIGLIQPLLLLLFVAGSRAVVQSIFGENYRRILAAGDLPRVLIYGAGNAGRQLASAIDASQEMRLAGFVDDDETLWRSTMAGKTVHPPRDLAKLVERHAVTDILLAMPSSSRARRSEILEELSELDVHVRTLPAFMDVARGQISVGDLKELDITDVLGRPPVPPNEELLHRLVAGKTVLVTGAGGSIGSELARNIASLGPAILLLADHSEYNLYTIDRELAEGAERDPSRSPPVPLLASVADAGRMEQIFARWRIDTVFHAAAYKHVPLVEANLLQGIRNNVAGTLTTARAAAEAGVRDFVLISTDKAVRPTNVMGATKRCAELVMQALDKVHPDTRFSMVRFGNVLGSSGSVVPLFRRQIEEGGPITLTHPDITRYFMSIPEAAQLVLQAGAMAKGGDVFVLDMGEPVKIYDLARTIIVLSGRTVRDAANPGGDIEISIDGLRPGEKLYEELLIGGETSPTAHERIMRCSEPFLPWSELEPQLRDLDVAVAGGRVEEAYAILRRLVPEFVPITPINDPTGEEPASGPVSEAAPGFAPPSRARRADTRPNR